MKKGIGFWPNKRFLKSISLLIAFVLFLNPIAFDLIQGSFLNKLFASQVAQAAVSERDGLGIKNFWNYYEKDLGAGWKCSINTFTGNLIIKKTLTEIPGRGDELSDGLVYNSLSSQSGPVGVGWKLESDLFVQENPDGSVTYKDETGTNINFNKNPDQSYTAPAGIYLTLTKVDTTTFTIKGTDNSIYRFQNGLLTSVTNAKGDVKSFSYDTNNRLTTITDPSGRQLTYNYDTDGRLSTLTDPSTGSISLGYDTNGRLALVTIPDGGTTRFSYNASGKIDSLIDANNRTTALFYGADGKLTKINDARSTQQKEYSISFTYDSSTLKTTIADPAGKSVVYTHNSGGNVIKTQDGEGVITDYTWENNNLINADDANGRTSVTYNSSGDPIFISKTIDVNTNSTTTVVYDSSHNPTSITDPNGNQQTAKYDAESNRLSAANPSRKEADANSYDAYGNITSSTEVGAPTYNLLQNGSFEVLDIYGKPQNWYYGGTTSAITIDTSVAMFGNRSVKISSTSETTAYVYGKSVSVTPGQKLTLNARIKIDQVSGTSGVTIGIQYYDANNVFVGSTWSNQIRGTATQGLVVTSDVPTGAAKAYANLMLYQAKGNVWFDGAQLEMPINEQEGHIFSRFDYVENSSFESLWNYWYAGGTSGAHSITNASPWAGAYSAKINQTTAGNAWVRSEYIPIRAGERLTLSGFIKTENLVGSGARIQIQYYDANKSYLGFGAASLQTGTQDYTRYALAQTVPTGAAYAIVYGNVISSSGTAYFDNIKLQMRATTTYYYDANANYLTDSYDPIGNWTNYKYDASGNRTEVKDPKGNVTRFAYDAQNNLTSVTDALSSVSRYEYDPVSMQVAYRDARSASSTDDTYKTSYTYDEINQITSVIDPLGRETTSTYDDAGNIVSVTYPNGKKVLYSYDAANRLKEQSYLGETKKYTYSYDSADNLSQVTDDESRTCQFTYDMANGYEPASLNQ